MIYQYCLIILKKIRTRYKRHRYNKNMKYKYRVGIHNTEHGYIEEPMEFSAPVSIGDHIATSKDEEEFLVTAIIHTDCDVSVIHCEVVKD